ncbi:hypothetical protein D3C81_2176350 [compost metagenome]
MGSVRVMTEECWDRAETRPRRMLGGRRTLADEAGQGTGDSWKSHPWLERMEGGLVHGLPRGENLTPRANRRSMEGRPANL